MKSSEDPKKVLALSIISASRVDVEAFGRFDMDFWSNLLMLDIVDDPARIENLSFPAATRFFRLVM